MFFSLIVDCCTMVQKRIAIERPIMGAQTKWTSKRDRGRMEKKNRSIRSVTWDWLSLPLSISLSSLSWCRLIPLTCFDLDHDPMPFIYPWSFCCCRRNFSTFLSLSLSFPFDLLRVCYILFAFELSFLKSAHCCSLIDNDLAINFMFVSSHLRAVCVSVCSLLFDHFFPKPIESLIRFIIIIITLHLQLILPRYYYFYVSFFSRTLSPLAFSLSLSQYIIDILFFVIFWGNFFICCGRKRMNLSSRDQQQQHSSCSDMNASQIMSHIYFVPLCVCAAAVDSFNRHNLLSH